MATPVECPKDAAASGGLMEGLSARGPKPARSFSSLPLELQEQARILHIGWNRHHQGVAEAHQFRVDHQVTHIHIGQEPAVAIALLHVELQPYRFPFNEPAVDRGRLPPSRLLALDGVMGLWRVHADVANLLDAAVEPDVDRVPIHDPEHRGGESLTGIGRRRGQGEDEGKKGEKPTQGTTPCSMPRQPFD